MAAVHVRALGYTDVAQGNPCTDDDGSMFEDAIARLRAAGITFGCNPPDNGPVLSRRAGDQGPDGAFPDQGARLS